LTYLGRFEDPFEIGIVCKCLLDYLDGAGDICLGERYDLDSHGGSFRRVGCMKDEIPDAIECRYEKPVYAPLYRRV
jgi:hypothetical protein